MKRRFQVLQPVKREGFPYTYMRRTFLYPVSATMNLIRLGVVGFLVSSVGVDKL
jgi:hypothetical protein